jgi:hypothetical protein
MAPPAMIDRMSRPNVATTPLRWHQLRLRTLLAAMTLAAGLCACWFRPFVVEQRYLDGQPRTRFVLRCDWQGRRVAHGTQTWYLPDGSKIERTSFGEPMTNDDFTTLLATGPDPDFDYLIWLITNTIEPESWDDEDGPGRINLNGCSLLVAPDNLPTAGQAPQPLR